MSQNYEGVDPQMITEEDRESLRLSHENEQLRFRLQTVQARLDELRKSANIWRTFWSGMGGEPEKNLAEKIDLINALEHADG